MADEIPAALRQADVNIYKCATKAVQLQRVKPIVAYWCEYWVVNQILAKQLHSKSEEMLQYTTTLMDRLETTKSEYANEDAIVDDTAGQAYIEQFAQETLDRAERVVKANKVTQTTATTFDAAATFFHLVNIWGTPDTETQQKIKYAKWNAARIAKAIKDGTDPNESNPKHDEAQPLALDPNDPEVQMLGGTSPAPQPATVEEVPDVDMSRDAAGVSLPHSPASAAMDGPSLPGVPTHLSHPAPGPGQPGYFDSHSMPSPVSPPPQNQSWAPTPPPPNPAAFASPLAAAAPPPTFAPSFSPTPAVAPPPPASQDFLNVGGPPVARSSAPQPNSGGFGASAPSVGNFVADEAAMVQAQKHAKWAISALNFEDVPTAVRELRKALAALGAS